MGGGIKCTQNTRNNMTISGNAQTNTSALKKPGHPTNKVHAMKGKVTFRETVEVVLIPCIQEYKDANLFRSLWWERSDLNGFQVALGIAFREYMETCTVSDVKLALRMFIDEELRRCASSGRKRLVGSIVLPDIPLQPVKKIKV